MPLAISASGISAVNRADCLTTKGSTSGMEFRAPRTRFSAPSEPAAKAAGVAFEHIMEGKKGEKSRELQVYDLEQRRLIDAEITRRTIDFMTRNVQSGKPFYAYVPSTQVHFPTFPNPNFPVNTAF